ncbi:unnamed protein product [Ilex paraguariensis]|uniref:TF-B3 domain-containing protein n=1 Tax=Ilex paraguariensis TaxID=185542 RepID=A0ABC8UDK1_9AQUA
MEGKTFGTASLVGPSGNTWHTELIQHADGLFFHDGWSAFVRDHFLECGDSLVFRHDGNLKFTVQVFDLNSCEKEEAFIAKCSQDQGECDNQTGKRRERENTALVDNIVEGIPKKMRSSEVHFECTTKNQEATMEITEKQGHLLEEVGSMGERCQTASILNATESCSSPLKNFVTLAVPSQSQVLSENSGANINHWTSKEDTLMSAAEADKVARSFASCFPNFIKVMKMFNISGSYTLNIPYQFSMAHLPKCKVKIVLRNSKGESWTVNSIPTTRVQTSHTFCGGWLGFVRDNNLKMGDICIFELLRKCELRVQILRVGKEGLDCKSGKVKHISALKSSVSKACKRKSVPQKKNSSQDKQTSHAKGCMSMKSAPEEKIAAESFISKFPHFVRIMKKFNIGGSYTLKIPYQFSMEHLPNCKTEIVLRNLKGESWTVNSIPSQRVQTLHTFCGGWMAFVRDNDLQMGDICIFELVGKCTMRVHISGLGKKGLEAASNELAAGSFPGNHASL